jgi:hypothetical protein
LCSFNVGAIVDLDHHRRASLQRRLAAARRRVLRYSVTTSEHVHATLRGLQAANDDISCIWAEWRRLMCKSAG